MARLSKRLQVRLGGRVRQLRAELGRSQAAIAERVGVTPEYISRIERGLVAPSLEIVSRLSDALGSEPAALFSETEGRLPADPLTRRLLDIATNATPEDRRLVLELAETVVKRRKRRF